MGDMTTSKNEVKTSKLPPGVWLQFRSGGCNGQDLNTTAPSAVAAGQTLVPNDVTSTRWQSLYPGQFGFIFVWWKELVMCRPSLFTVNGKINKLQLSADQFSTPYYLPLKRSTLERDFLKVNHMFVYSMIKVPCVGFSGI